MNSKVSIIIPFYNSEKTIQRCLDSVLKQSYKNIEIVLIDDGSTDNSSGICYEYSTKDKRIMLFHKNNSGVSSSRNFGIKKSSGDYIVFLDADDTLGADAIRSLVESYLDGQLVGLNRFIDGDMRIKVNNNKNIYAMDDILSGELGGFTTGFLFVKQSCPFFDERISYCEDMVFLINYIVRNGLEKIKIIKGETVYYNYIQEENSITRAHNNIEKTIDDINIAMDSLANIINCNKKRYIVERRRICLFESVMQYATSEEIKTIINCYTIFKYDGKKLNMKIFSLLYRKGMVGMISFYYVIRRSVKRIIGRKV